MRKLLLIPIILLLFTGLSFSSDDLQEEVKELKEKVAELEKRLEKQEAENPLKNIDISFGITMIGQGNTDDDKSGEEPYESATDTSYSFDIEISKTFKNSEIYMHLEGGDGEGRDREITTWTGINGDAYDTDSEVRLSELHFSSNIKNIISFTFGKVDLTGYFDTNEVANDETTQFLSAGLVNNPGVEFPDYGPGIVTSISPSDAITIILGYESIDDAGDPEWDNFFNGGFFIGELDLSLKPLGLPGNYRFYYWNSNRDHEDYSDGAKVKGENNEGIGISIDQVLIKDILTAFVRFGWQDEDLSEFESFYSGGFELSGSIWERSNDRLGIAYQLCKISDEFEDYRKQMGSEQKEDEHHFELYYKLPISEYLELSFDYQWIKNPAGYDDLDDVHLIGLRTQISF